MFFKEHIERVRINVYNLEKMEVILDIPWLAIHNPEIDWKKGEVKIMRCLPICRKKNSQKNGKREDSRGTGTKKVLEVKKGIWKSGVKKNTSTKGLESCNKAKREFHV